MRGEVDVQSGKKQMHDNQWRDTYKKLIMIRELED
jgi:hypothetical protein